MDDLLGATGLGDAEILAAFNRLNGDGRGFPLGAEGEADVPLAMRSEGYEVLGSAGEGDREIWAGRKGGETILAGDVNGPYAVPLG